MPEIAGTGTLRPPVSDARDHVAGDAHALVTLVEYGDYECPHCAAAQPVVGRLVELFGERLRMVFRHFPLSQIHPHATRAAEAAEAAAAQDQFWEMHEALFENQDALEDEDLGDYAAAIGLDVREFVHELAEGAHLERVREDFMSGVRSGVNGTPTFFVDGVRHDGLADFESLQAAIGSSLAGREAEGARSRKPHELKTKRREA